MDYRNGKCNFTIQARELLVVLNRCQSTFYGKPKALKFTGFAIFRK